MAINFTDFSKVAPTPSPWADVFENALKGYQIGQEPAKMARKAEEEKLANSIKELTLKQMPEEWALKKQVAESQIAKNKRVGTGAAVAKASGDYANWLVAHPNATQDEKTGEQERLATLKTRSTESNISSRDKYANSIGFRTLPADEKSRAVAMTTGMGLDPTEGEQKLIEGQSLSDMAKEKGLNINDVVPVYPVGAELRKQTQRRAAYVNELGVFDKHIAEGLGQYQNKFQGWSLDQIADATKGDDPEKQGRLLAARALGPELAGLRFKVAGGNLGIEALREMQDKSLTKINILESQVSPKAYAAMQRYMDKWLIEANSAFNQTVDDYGKLKVGHPNTANVGGMTYEPVTTGEPKNSGAFNFNDFPVAKR